MFELKEAVVSVGAADVFSGCSATAGVACCSFYLRSCCAFGLGDFLPESLVLAICSKCDCFLLISNKLTSTQS